MADDGRLDEMQWTAAGRADVRLVENEFCLIRIGEESEGT